MECWKSGIMEKWNNGILEYWNNGKLAKKTIIPKFQHSNEKYIKLEELK
jgi:hypothetical protein